MTTSKRILRALNNALFKILPGQYYVQIARWVIPILDPQRRDFSSSVKKVDSNYLFDTGDFRIFFHSPFNVGRYLFGSEQLQIKERMWKKYTGDIIQIDSGDVVVDVGANVGEFSLAALDRGAKVYAFEPDPRPYGCLALNLGKHANAHIFQKGLGAETGSLPFYFSSGHNDSSFIRPSSGIEKIDEIAVDTLDTFCKAQGISRINLLKIEAEGYEPEVLRGAMGALAELVEQVAVDGGPERLGATTIDECERLLLCLGFSVERLGHILYGKK